MGIKQFYADLRNLPDQQYQRARYIPRYVGGPSLVGKPACGCPSYELAVRNGKFIGDAQDVFDELCKRYDIEESDIEHFALMFDKISAKGYPDDKVPVYGTLKDIKKAVKELEK